MCTQILASLNRLCGTIYLENISIDSSYLNLISTVVIGGASMIIRLWIKFMWIEMANEWLNSLYKKGVSLPRY